MRWRGAGWAPSGRRLVQRGRRLVEYGLDDAVGKAKDSGSGEEVVALSPGHLAVLDRLVCQGEEETTVGGVDLLAGQRVRLGQLSQRAGLVVGQDAVFEGLRE